MGAPKRSGKGRLDHYYKLAKEKGFRARSAFKLIQINRKYNFLQGTKVLIDLCAAPGGWLQVAAETLPPDSLIIGVDLVPIKPIPRVITIAGDITTDKCRAAIRQHLKTWKADTVLHDGSPHVGSAWLQDSFNQAELVLESLRLATDFLIEGGTFVTKIFRSKDYNPLLWVFNQLFATVEATKPPSSRNVSAEIFVICRGFKAPKRIDPRFLDPRAVFAELDGPAPNNEAKIYKPETKKRKRDGYEEGEYLQFKEIPASEFIHATDPIAILANHNRFTFAQPPNGDVALAALDRLPETTTDIRARCADLKVLGRGDFKALLKWRLRVRDLFGLASVSTPARPLSEQVATEEEAVEVEPMDEELRIVQELQELRERDSAKKKKERRRENERKQKDIIRMQMGMTAPMDIAKEQSLFAHGGEGTMFGIKALGQAGQDGALDKIAKGKMAIIKESDPKDGGGAEFGVSAPSDHHLDAADDDGDRLEESLDSMYENYKTKKAEVDAKYRAKRARQEHDDDEWEGLSVSDGPGSDTDFDLEMDDSDGTDDDDDAEGPMPRQAQAASKDGLSRKAQGFFDQDIFREIPGLDQALAGLEVESAVQPQQQHQHPSKSEVPTETAPAATRKKPDSDMDVVEGRNDEEDGWEDEPRRTDGHIDIDLVTAEAMTLARSLASGEKTRYDVVDDGFNKHAFRDRDGLPDWFLDDEKQHDKPHKPITKAASAAIQEKLRALNARPIKKVREAKARKKFKMAQKLEKLRKKSDVLANDEGMTEKEKAASISKLLRKATKKKPRQPAQLVIAKGINKGVRGRPSGVAKGRRYKLVDARMKKDLRAQKRIAKRK